MAKPRRQQHRVNKFERVRPTPETMRKLARDDWRLTLSPDQQRAAEMIMAGFETLTNEARGQTLDFSRDRIRGASAEATAGEELIEVR